MSWRVYALSSLAPSSCRRFRVPEQLLLKKVLFRKLRLDALPMRFDSSQFALDGFIFCNTAHFITSLPA
jgi:hypothetical protein